MIPASRGLEAGSRYTSTWFLSRGFGPCLQVLKGPRNARCQFGWILGWIFLAEKKRSSEIMRKVFFTSNFPFFDMMVGRRIAWGVTPTEPQQNDAKLSKFHLLDDFAKTFQQMEWIQSGNLSQWRHRVLFCSQENHDLMGVLQQEYVHCLGNCPAWLISVFSWLN